MTYRGLMGKRWSGALVISSLILLVVVPVTAFERPTRGIEDPPAAQRPLDAIRDALGHAVEKNAEVDYATQIAALDAAIKSMEASDRAELPAAYALRGALRGQNRDLDRAISDLLKAVESDKPDLMVEVPTRGIPTQGPGSPAALIMETRPAGELLYECSADIGQFKPFQLVQARSYISLARKAAKTRVSATKRDDLLAMYDRDEKLIDILNSDASDQNIAARLLDEVLVSDGDTGLILVRNSKCVSQALLRAAELLDKTLRVDPIESLDARRLDVVVQRVRLTPIQIVQLSLSLDSTTENDRRHGLTVLQGLYERANATQLVDRARLAVGTASQPEGHALTPAEEAFKGLFGGDNASTNLEVLDRTPARMTALDVVRDHINPVFSGSIEVKPLSFSVNVLQLKPAMVQIPAWSDLSDGLAAQAVRALLLWEMSCDPTRRAQGPDPVNEALTLGAEVSAMLQDRIGHPVSLLGADNVTSFTQLLDARRKLAKGVPSDRAERLARFVQFSDILAKSRLLEGAPGGRPEVLELYRLVYLEKNAPLQRSRAILEPLARSLIRHGLFAESTTCIDNLTRLDQSQGHDVPQTLLLRVELQRRQGKEKGAGESEGALIALFQQRLGVTDPTGSDVRAALLSLARLTTTGYRVTVGKALDPLFKSADYRSTLLNVLALERLPEFDAFLAEQVRKEAVGLGSPRSPATSEAGWSLPESWEAVLAAAARSGGRQTVEVLTDAYQAACLPPLAAPAGPAPPPTPASPATPVPPVAAPRPPAPSRLVSPVDRHETFRQVTEAIASLDPYAAFSVACDFYAKSPEFLKIPRPNGHRVEIARILPLPKATSSGSIRDAWKYHHIPIGVERMTGREFVISLADRAKATTGVPQAIELALDRVLVRDRSELRAEAALARARLLIAKPDGWRKEVDRLLNIYAVPGKPWWPQTDPNALISLCDSIFKADSTEKVPSGSKPENLSRSAALHHVIGTAALAALDVSRARVEFTEVSRLVEAVRKLSDAQKAAEAQRKADPKAKVAAPAVETTLEIDTHDRYIQQVESGVSVPFLPRPLTFGEALALAYLLDRSTGAIQSGAALDVLAVAEGLKGTTYLDGLEALRALVKRPPPVTMNPGDPLAEETLALIGRVMNSGLVPVGREQSAANAPVKAVDQSQQDRLRNLSGASGGLGVGGRVGVLIPFYVAPDKPPEWIHAEDAMFWALRSSHDFLAASEGAYTGWAARQSAESLTLPEPATAAGGARTRRPVFAASSAPPSGPTAASTLECLNEIERVRTVHRFADATEADPSVSGLYLPDNDRGVRAAIRGDFATARMEFSRAIAEDSKTRTDIRRLLKSHELLPVRKQPRDVWSVAASNGRPDAPAEPVFAEVHLGLTAQRNLAVLDALVGQYGEALSLYHKTLEVELRGGAVPHPDALFRLLDLESRFSPEASALRDAAQALFSASIAMQERRPADALDILDALPVEFRETKPALRLRLAAQLLRLAGLMTPGDDEARRIALLKDCDLTAVKLAQHPLRGDEKFARDPNLMLLHADIRNRLHNLSVASKLESTYPAASQEDRQKAGALFEEGLEQIAKLLVSDKPPTREDCPDWVMAYLDAAPGILGHHADLFQMNKDKPAPCPKALDIYSALVAASCGDKFDPFRTSLVLRPLTQNTYSGYEALLIQALPVDSKPESIARLEALGKPDASGMSRLDWLLAALVRSAGMSNQTQAHSHVKEACNLAAQAGETYEALLDALTALDPAMAAQVAVGRLAAIPPDRILEAEAVLARRSIGTFRRVGVLARPLVADRVSDTWYRDSDAFWYSPGDRPRITFGERLAESLGALVQSPQQFALTFREWESFLRRDRLDAANKAGGSALGRFHASVAETLARAGTPSALGLLLRYTDCGEGSLSSASKTASNRSYKAVAQAPWLVDEPGQGVWNGQYGPVAWTVLRRDLPDVIELNAPRPNSAFVEYLGAAITSAIAGREQKVPRLLFTEETSLADSVHNDLLAAVIAANELPQPALTPGPPPATFAEAINRVRAETTVAIQVARAARDKAAKPDPALDKRQADSLVNTELDRFTIRLWCVASHFAAQQKSLRQVRLSDVSQIYGELPLLLRLKGSGRDYTSPRTDEKIEGPLNDGVYLDDLKLKGRRLAISDDLTKAVYEETFERDGTMVIIRGEIPEPYRQSLKEQPRLLDLLDLSLARRAAMLRNPSGPIRLSLDMALLAPQLVWPALMQDSGASYLNGYLATCTRDLKPRTAQEFIAAVAPETVASTDARSRLAQRDIQNGRLVQAAFEHYYSSRALGRAHEIPDALEEHLFGIGFLKLRSVDNTYKRGFLSRLGGLQGSSTLVLNELNEQNFFRLCSKDDPPRYVFVTETGLSDDREDWICTYRIVTALGHEVKFVVGGKVAGLSEVCRKLIRVNPGVVKRLKLDLGGLTADPTLQLILALRATAAVESGEDSVLSVLDRLGLTVEEMKRAIHGDGSPFVGKQAAFFNAKDQTLRELGQRAGVVGGDAPVVSPSEYLADFIKQIDSLDQKIRSQSGDAADKAVDDVKHASQPVNVFGIPGLLQISFQDGKFHSFSIAVTFKGNVDEPRSFAPVLPINIRDPIGNAERSDAVPRMRPIDPRAGIEKPSSTERPHVPDPAGLPRQSVPNNPRTGSAKPSAL